MPRQDEHTKSIYTGPASVMRDSEFMASEDLMALPGQKIDVAIERVEKHTNVKFADGRTIPELYALKFKGAQRVLRVNSTSKKWLVAKCGIKTADWTGQRVQLYIDQCRRPDLKGAMGPCIRIRDAAPPKQAAPTEKTTEQLEAEAADRAAEQREQS